MRMHRNREKQIINMILMKIIHRFDLLHIAQSRNIFKEIAFEEHN